MIHDGHRTSANGVHENPHATPIVGELTTLRPEVTVLSGSAIIQRSA